MEDEKHQLPLICQRIQKRPKYEALLSFQSVSLKSKANCSVVGARGIVEGGDFKVWGQTFINPKSCDGRTVQMLLEVKTEDATA